MITREWKINVLLDTYPQALDVLVTASPHFKKLQNKLLRKALAPRVTVEQAAGIGGVEVEDLLVKLNAAAGLKYTETSLRDYPVQQAIEQEAEKVNQAILNTVSGGREIVIDVRPIIGEGRDPLKEILKTVRELPDGYSLHLINSFEPIPLYSVLGGKGFDHSTKRMDGVWHIYFFRRQIVEYSRQNTEYSKQGGEYSRQEVEYAERLLELDVRGLAPPEPMMKILEKLGEVDENTILLVHHHREPMMLYEKLEQRGYEAIANKIEENYYKVVIRKKKS